MSPATLTPINTRQQHASVQPLPAARLADAKRAYTTRRADPAAMRTLVGGIAPRAGDLVLARIVQLGKHEHLESCEGRRCRLFPGDEIVVAYGNRYAPDQFEAEVPDALGPCHLVAGGGVAARMLSRHEAVRPATQIEPIGLIGDQRGQPLSVSDFRLPAAARSRRRPLTLAVAGTAMNAGKTTAVAGLVHGAHRAGLRVVAAKITGTGSGGDTWLMRDAGATAVLDFTDAGMVSTYRCTLGEIEDGMALVLAHLAALAPDLVVLEIADGLYQAETAALIASPRFAAQVDAMLFAAGDAMGAAAGVQWLRERGRRVLAVTGALTRSPLAMREAAAACRLPVLGLAELEDPAQAASLVAGERGARRVTA